MFFSHICAPFEQKRSTHQGKLFLCSNFYLRTKVPISCFLNIIQLDFFNFYMKSLEIRTFVLFVNLILKYLVSDKTDFERNCVVMSFFGILLSLAGISVCIWCAYVVFRDVLYPLYEEKCLQKKYSKNLADKVRWIVISGAFGSIFDSRGKLKDVRDRELYKYIEREQYKLKVENNYCIDFSNEKEINFVCEILETHKTSVSESLFRDSLTKDKTFYKLDYFEYYMFSLFGFLEKNENKNGDFNNKVLYKFFSKDGSYTTYKFTDYGVIYQKLFYITTLFCVNNENIKSLFTNPENTLNGVKENLEKGEIVFWTYRP